MRSLYALLGGAIGYAGLYPPASLTPRQIVENYLSYRSSQYGWALGNLLLPGAALSKLEQIVGAGDVPVSVVFGDEPERELHEISRRSQANGRLA